MKVKISLGSALVVSVGIFIASHYSKKGLSDNVPLFANVDDVVIPKSFQEAEDVVVYLVGKHDKPCTVFTNMNMTRFRHRIYLRPNIEILPSCSNRDLEYEQSVHIPAVPYGVHLLGIGRANDEPLTVFLNRNTEKKYKTSILDTKMSLSVKNNTLHIALLGKLPTDCYKADYPEAFVEKNTITVYANVIEDIKRTNCSNVQSAYMEDFNLKNLPEKRYYVRLMSDDDNYKEEQVIDMNDHQELLSHL